MALIRKAVANLNSHDPTIIVNNVIGLAKVAKVFGVPVILTTVTEERGGHIIKGLQDVFPDNKPIDRTFINTWQDDRVLKAIRPHLQLIVHQLCTKNSRLHPTVNGTTILGASPNDSNATVLSRRKNPGRFWEVRD